jgi:hypothetical protein
MATSPSSAVMVPPSASDLEGPLPHAPLTHRVINSDTTTAFKEADRFIPIFLHIYLFNITKSIRVFYTMVKSKYRQKREFASLFVDAYHARRGGGRMENPVAPRKKRI